MPHFNAPSRLLRATVLLATLAASAAAWADGSPVGLWKSIDDATGKPKALIRISENNGELSGKIEKLFRAPEEDQNPLCVKCEGALKDQPVIGMTTANVSANAVVSHWAERALTSKVDISRGIALIINVSLRITMKVASTSQRSTP